MATLVMVRHGQASFLEDNYDKLSPLGWAQARRLGAYWAQRGLTFSRFATGPCVRQRDTAVAVMQALHAGGPTPEPEPYPEFDEYPGQEIMAAALPALLERDPDLRALHLRYTAAESPATRRAAFQRVYEQVMSAWAQGALDLPGIESWEHFRSRVNAGLDRLLRAGEGIGSGAKPVVLFTSGGCIAVAMQRALGLDTDITLDASYRSRNSSWSEFLFSGSRFTLASFNSFAHLDDPAMLTYR